MIFNWLQDNKDAILALAAVLSPLTAIIAVIIGPRVQREIAKGQFKVSNRQIDLQYRSLDLTSRQLRANLMGVFEQRWIDNFQEMVAKLVGLVDKRLPIRQVQAAQSATYDLPKLLEIQNEIVTLISAIEITIGPGNGNFLNHIRKLSMDDDMASSANRRSEVIKQAHQFVAERKERLIALVADPSLTPPGVPPLPPTDKGSLPQVPCGRIGLAPRPDPASGAA